MLLLTAPTGNVGAEVVKLMMQDKPIPFRIGAHRPENIKRMYGDDAPAVYFDFDDRSTWDAVLDGVDKVFLVFPLPMPRNVKRWMIPFIDEMVKRGVKHVVYLDVTAAKDSEVVPHYHVERYLESSGIAYTFLRSSYFMQNLCRGLSTHGVDIVENDELFIPAGNGTMTFLDARDVAEAVVNIMKNPEPHENKAYLLAGPEDIDMKQVASIFSDVFGRPIRYTNPNALQFAWRLFRRRVKWDVIGFMTIVYTITRRGQNSDFSPDLENLLGRKPRNMRQFVTEEKWRWDTRTWT
ncbi:MAG: SDR family oxidoreductase [bacterium]|nr:SDR family oxidoreductase [bacterium]